MNSSGSGVAGTVGSKVGVPMGGVVGVGGMTMLMVGPGSPGLPGWSRASRSKEMVLASQFNAVNPIATRRTRVFFARSRTNWSARGPREGILRLRISSADETSLLVCVSSSDAWLMAAFLVSVSCARAYLVHASSSLQHECGVLTGIHSRSGMAFTLVRTVLAPLTVNRTLIRDRSSGIRK